MPDVKKTKKSKTPKPEYIKNYGLFWRRDDVDWNAPLKEKHLLGYKKINKNYTVDFCKQIGFYALYGDAFNLVYFGQVGTGDTTKRTLYTRLKEHRNDKHADRWSRFSWFGIRKVKNLSPESKKLLKHLERAGELSSIEIGKLSGDYAIFLNQIEAVVIAVAEPPRNGNAGVFSGATEYLQHKR